MQEEKKREKRGAQAVTSLFTAAGGGALAVVALLWLMAFLLYSGAIPAKYMAVCPYVAVAVGGLLCGLLSARFPKRLYGALGSAGLMVLFFGLVGMLIPNTAFFLPGGGAVLAISLVCSVLSSVILSVFR